jgi:predicted dehydrogenase
MAKKKFGIVGCGSIAEIAHLPAITGNDSAELVSVCDVDAKRAEEIAGKWKAKSSYTDYRKMFDKERLDAVVIATPNNYHRNQVVAAARRGMHILVEKPMAVTNREAWEMVDAAKKNRVKLMVGCDRRYWVHNEWAKDLIEKGVIGRVLMSRACLHEHWYNYQKHIARTGFRLDVRMTGGAAINDTGAHAIDLLVWLNGSKVKRVVGVAERLAMPESYTLNDDVALLMVEFETGAFGTVSCNRFSPAVNQNTELCGTEGTIFTSTDATNPFQSWPMAVYTNKKYTQDTLPEILRNYRWPELFWVEDIASENVRNRWVPICPPRYPNNYQRMLSHFLDCVINDKEPRTSGEDGARAVEVMCAVLKSRTTHTWIDLPLKEEVVPEGYEALPKDE